MIAETPKVLIRLNFSFVAMVTIMLCLCDEKVVLSALVASFLHESGHIFFLTLFRCTPVSITLSAFGICIDRPPHSPLSFRRELAVALGGIGFNLAGSAALALCGLFWHNELIGYAIAVNLLVALINSLPNENLDSGRALFFLLLCITDEEKAEKIIRLLSVAFALAALIFFFIYTLIFGFNISLAAVTIYLSIMTFQGKVVKQ